MTSDDYFSQQATLKRINAGQRRQLFFVIHLVFVLSVTAAIVFDSIQAIQFISQAWPDRDLWTSFWINFSGPERSLLIGAWLSFALHYVWKRSRFNAENMLDREMRETREYELRRYELERDLNHDAEYRLGDDGELFYAPDEIEYELKPKRKRYE